MLGTSLALPSGLMMPFICDYTYKLGLVPFLLPLVNELSAPPNRSSEL
jgi:hypothetical protein